MMELGDMMDLDLENLQNVKFNLEDSIYFLNFMYY